MAREAAPILIGYDGAAVSRAAVRQAGELFAGRAAVVVTVWEPALTAVPVALPGTIAVTTLPADPATTDAVDRRQRERAATLAADGAELARSVGLVAEPLAVSDDVDVADTLLALARERAAAVIVVGSHVISGLRSHLLGSVSRKVIEHGAPAGPRHPRRQRLATRARAAVTRCRAGRRSSPPPHARRPPAAPR
jgi:nucleotide-binding universal stress UspA family protein